MATRDRIWAATTGAVDRTAVDEGLRAYMLRVYNYMGSGLALSGIVAVMVYSTPAVFNAIFGSGLGIVVMLAPLGLLLAMSFGFNKIGASALQGLYWVFVALMGVSLATVFVVYQLDSVVRVFFITAALFGVMSLYGYTTKRSLASWGSFLFMGLIGIIIAMVVNMFLASAMIHWVVSVLGVIIFTGLTAYDTQRIKSEFVEYRMQGGLATKTAVMGAVHLYLNFINLFLFLLSLMGGRN